MSSPVTTDGRTVRRQTNRARVVDAMLELVDATGAEPTVEQVVERSGVSERSIFRYFEGLDDLRRAVLQRNFERLEPLLVVDDIGHGTLGDRAERFVATRARVCEAMAGVARLGRRNAQSQPVIATEMVRLRRLLEKQVRTHFRPELAARTGAEADDAGVVIDVLFSTAAWDQLTIQHGRSPAQIRRAWTRALLALLA